MRLVIVAGASLAGAGSLGAVLPHAPASTARNVRAVQRIAFISTPSPRAARGGRGAERLEQRPQPDGGERPVQARVERRVLRLEGRRQRVLEEEDVHVAELAEAP